MAKEDEDKNSQPPLIGAERPEGTCAGERTRVDLGDDLVEGTGLIPIQAPQLQPFDPDDQLHSATILMNEGILEDAKKVLRQILIVNPHYVAAREKLDEIHELELKQIFGDDQRQRIRAKTRTEEARIDSEIVMRQLDEDLQLGIFVPTTIFKSPDAEKQLEAPMDRALAGCGPRDRLDVGIAFLEMGLCESAVRQFRIAAKTSDFLRPATALLAYALILSGRSFEAIQCIEPILGDFEASKEDQIEFLYLMARANEALLKTEVALAWYERVRELDSYYRDAAERMKNLSQRSRKGN